MRAPKPPSLRSEIQQIKKELNGISTRLFELAEREEVKEIHLKEDGWVDSASWVIAGWLKKLNWFIDKLSDIIDCIPSKRRRRKDANKPKRH
jgi:hypothetical protein